MLVLEAVGIRRIDRLTFSPTGRELAAGEWDGVCVWNLDTLRAEKTLPANGVCGLGHMSDGRLVVGTRAGLFIRAGSDIFRRVLFEPLTVTVVSPASPFVVADSTCFRVTTSSAFGKVWSDPQGLSYAPAISADGEWLVTPFHTDESHGVRIAELATGCVVRTVTLSAGLPQVVVAPDRSCFASLYFNRIHCWRPGRSRKVATFGGETADDVSAIAFHPSGRYLAAACHDHRVKLYDADTGQLAHAFAWNMGRLRSLAFSPDGTLAAAGSDSGKVVVWDVDV